VISLFLNTVNVTTPSIKISADTSIPTYNIPVSENTGDKNMFVKKFPFSVYLFIKAPPKNLNKSKLAKILYFNQLAPLAINVIIKFAKYINTDTETAATYDLNIVDIKKVSIINTVILINIVII
jgi:hypothetical protein